MRRFALIIITILFCTGFLWHKKPKPAIQFQITGLNEPALSNALEDLKHQADDLKAPFTAAKIRPIYNKSKQSIQNAIKPYGYFYPQISSKLYQDNGQWIAVYSVNPGPRLHITQVSVQLTGPGRHDQALQNFVNNFPIKTGQGFDSEAYSKAKDSFFRMAHNQGYLSAKFTTHVIRIDLDRHRADIHLVFNTGPRYYFGPVHFSHTPYAESLLYRFIPFKYGEPYSSDKVLALQNNLSQSIYFNHVTVTPKKEKAKNQYIPVDVFLLPKKSQQYSFGLGYGTDTGLRGSLGWEWRRVTNTGHYFQAIIQASQVQNNFQARYVIPGRNPVTSHYSIYAGIVNNNPGKGSYRTSYTGVNYVTFLNGWQQTFALSYQHENFNVLPQGPYQTTQYLMPELTWQKVQADDRINTNNGYRIFFHILGGQSVMNGKHQFLQGEIRGKYIKTFWQNNRIIFRSDLGYTVATDNAQVPLSVRFFAGGAQSVRGYNFQDLGPGLYLTVASAEYQHRIYGNWYGATFYDIGNAYNKLPAHLQRAVGVGIVWRSPLGPMELTVARGMNHPNPKFLHSLKVQFVMGPDL